MKGAAESAKRKNAGRESIDRMRPTGDGPEFERRSNVLGKLKPTSQPFGTHRSPVTVGVPASLELLRRGPSVGRRKSNQICSRARENEKKVGDPRGGRYDRIGQRVTFI